jgi:rare lipoprotein A
LRIRKAVGNAALAGAMLVVGTLYLALEKDVTLVVDGRPQAVRTLSASVGDLLDASGIVLEDGGVVVPPAATPLADGMTVVEDTAVTTGPADVGVWVVEGADGPSVKLAAQSSENWFSASQPIGPSRTTAVTVVVLGKDHDVITNAATVRELLSAMGIAPDGRDRVSPPPSTPLHPGLRVRYTDIDVRLRDVQVPIPFATATTFSDSLDPGEVRVVRAGSTGLAVQTYRVRIVNHEIVSRSLLHQRVLRPAIAQRRIVGLRENGSHGSQVGEASYYTFAPGTGLTAAHPWLPFGTVVTVENLASGRTVQVVINDRGPFGGRIIDLSDEAFARIAPLSQGVCQVRLTW